MKKWIVLLLSAIVALAASGLAACGSPKDDAAGERIVAGDTVTLSILDYFGVDVVAVPQGAARVDEKYADTARYPVIGTAMSLDVESIYLLDPSEVIVSDTIEQAFGTVKAPLENMGITVKLVSYNSIADLKTTISLLGDYCGRQDKAAELLARLAEEEETVRRETLSLGSPKVMVLFGAPMGKAEESIMVETELMYGGSLIAYMGGINVATAAYPNETRGMFVPTDWERLIDASPDYIFCIAHGSPSEVWQMYGELWETTAFQQFDAVKNDRVYYLPSEIVNVTATLGYTQSMSYLLEIFRGEVGPYDNNGAVT